MVESVAIALQVIDEHPESGLAPAPDTPERASYYQWSVFASAELDPALSDVMLHSMHLPTDQRVPEIEQRGRDRFAARADMLCQALESRDYLLGPEFSGADIMIGYCCNWALEELGVAYDSSIVNLLKGEQDTDSYRAIHPLGVVPALATARYTIFESVKIVLQLVDEHPEANLAPALGSPERAYYYQWSVFACSELDPAIMKVFDNSLRPLEAMRPPQIQHDPGVAAQGRAEFTASQWSLQRVGRPGSPAWIAILGVGHPGWP